MLIYWTMRSGMRGAVSCKRSARSSRKVRGYASEVARRMRGWRLVMIVMSSEVIIGW